MRLTPLVNEHYYHLYQRGADKRPIFKDKRDYSRMYAVLKYYLQISPPMKFSKYLSCSKERNKIILKKTDKIITHLEIICFALMPNHFHLLVKQTKDNGISKYMKNISDSYTKYFNQKYKRNGALFQGPFKTVYIESDEQLWHLSRYIHLNPLTSFVVKNFQRLSEYEWSSLPQYIGKNDGFCKTDIILASYPSREKYCSFLENRAEYQQQLETIKHLCLE